MNKSPKIRQGMRGIWGKPSLKEIDSAIENLYSLVDIIKKKHQKSEISIKKIIRQLFDSFNNKSDQSKEETASSSYLRGTII